MCTGGGDFEGAPRHVLAVNIAKVRSFGSDFRARCTGLDECSCSIEKVDDLREMVRTQHLDTRYCGGLARRGAGKYQGFVFISGEDGQR